MTNFTVSVIGGVKRIYPAWQVSGISTTGGNRYQFTVSFDSSVPDEDDAGYTENTNNDLGSGTTEEFTAILTGILEWVNAQTTINGVSLETDEAVLTQINETASTVYSP